jgi:hypothetical protein
MSYPSIDLLQKNLAKDIFGDRQDTKKASGRALGTLLELLTYYIFKEWGLTNNMTIELRIPEFGNQSITHNVEFALHPKKFSQKVQFDYQNSFTVSRFKKANEELIRKISNYDFKNKSLLTKDKVLKNNALIAMNEDNYVIINHENNCSNFNILDINPYAMVECKRVGVEEGNKKGPTTIEKAKQGAYVARSVSSLQKVRSRDGNLMGVFETMDGIIKFVDFEDELNKFIESTPKKDMKGFVLSIGIVSNHGNWFSEEKLNKELLVLKDSYDYLLFLKDESMVEFVQDTMINPSMREFVPIKKAFLDSYDKSIKGNKLTKVNLYYDAHKALMKYFNMNIAHIEKNWFNIISPKNIDIETLKKSLNTLKHKFDN